MIGVDFLDKFSFIIGENLKKFREKRKLSLDNVAKLSGVSKSMLGQIERGEANPTVSTVWKIANGLKISFTELMIKAESNIEVVDKYQLEPLVEDNNRVRIFPVFSFDTTRRFEMYSIEFDSNGYLSTEAHQQGTQEFITVFSGKLDVSINNENHTITAGNSIRFKADSIHSYKNVCEEICLVSMVIYYPA